MEKNYFIAIDLGGTNIKSALIRDGVILKKASIKTFKERPYVKIIEDMAGMCASLCKDAKIELHDVAAIGAGSPGAIDSKCGTVIYSNNIRWDNVPLGCELTRLTGIETYVTNDANAAALGEAKFGSGKNFEDSVLITLGTGVGGGIVIGGRLFEGYKSAGGEVGHMVISVGGEPCTCGRLGCFESYASATALIRETEKAMLADKDSLMHKFAKSGQADGQTAFLASRQGDKAAQGVVENYILHLSEGIINLVNILRPQVVILGGGVCNEGDYLLIPLRKLVEKGLYGGAGYAPVEIKAATLGNDAGLLGAYAFALQSINPKAAD